MTNNENSKAAVPPIKFICCECGKSFINENIEKMLKENPTLQTNYFGCDSCVINEVNSSRHDYTPMGNNGSKL